MVTKLYRIFKEISTAFFSKVKLKLRNNLGRPSRSDFVQSEFVGGISVTKVKLTITESKCRCGYFKKGQEFIVEDLCPPLCHELWNNIYPSVYALQNGASLDYGEGRAKVFDAKCPDEGRVCIHGEVID